MKSPQKPISMKRLRKLAEKFCNLPSCCGENFGHTGPCSEKTTPEISLFLSYVSDHKNDNL